MYNNKLKAIVLPVVIALAIVLGMGINSLLDHKEVPVNMGQRMIGSKLDYILNMINYSYVDSVDIHKIEEDAIPQILNDLDPHTVYIPAKDMQRVNEEMVGNFGGVGVQFYKYLDTVTVVKVVPGGPSEAAGLEERLEKQIQAYEAMFALWNEFDASLIKVSDVHLGIKKIAGVRVPLLENVDFDIRPYSLFNSPKWYSDGIHLLKGLAQTAIEREFMLAKLNLLEHARKKTTQKVNLFEKVQIPGYQDALRKIKRFMEDEENLSKSSQKILKSIQEKRKEAEA